MDNLVEPLAVSPEEWAEWREYRVSRLLLEMLQHHLTDLEQVELDRFRAGAGLDDDPTVESVRRAKAIGASEVYRYLLTMTEEDLNAN